MATASLCRMVAIEFGMCRSGRNGGSSGSVTFGNGRAGEPPRETHRGGGNALPLGDQESVGRDAQRGMMMEAAPSAALEVAKPNLLLEFLVVALDAPAQLCAVHQALQRRAFGQRREPVFGWLALVLGPLDQQPLFWPALAALEVAPRNANTRTSKA